MTTIRNIAEKLGVTYIYNPYLTGDDAFFLEDYTFDDRQYDILPFVLSEGDSGIVLEINTNNFNTAYYAVDVDQLRNIELEEDVNYVYVSPKIIDSLTNKLLYFNGKTEPVNFTYQFPDFTLIDIYEKLILLKNNKVYDIYNGRFKDAMQSFEDRNDKYRIMRKAVDFDSTKQYIIKTIKGISMIDANIENLEEVMESSGERAIYIMYDVRPKALLRYGKEISELFTS